jgi:hypothetical protein
MQSNACIKGDAVQEQVDLIAESIVKNPLRAILEGECADTEINDFGAFDFQNISHFNHVVSRTLASENTHQFSEPFRCILTRIVPQGMFIRKRENILIMTAQESCLAKPIWEYSLVFDSNIVLFL